MSPGRRGPQLPAKRPHRAFRLGLFSAGSWAGARRRPHFPDGEAEAHFPARASAERGPSPGSPDNWSAAAPDGLVRNAPRPHQLGWCRLVLRGTDPLPGAGLSGRTNLIRPFGALLQLTGVAEEKS